MAGITNTQLMKAINEMNGELKTYIAYRKDDYKRLIALDEDINGNGKKGMKYQSNVLWEEREEKKGMTKEVKIIILASVINGLMTAGSIFNLI